MKFMTSQWILMNLFTDRCSYGNVSSLQFAASVMTVQLYVWEMCLFVFLSQPRMEFHLSAIKWISFSHTHTCLFISPLAVAIATITVPLGSYQRWEHDTHVSYLLKPQLSPMEHKLNPNSSDRSLKTLYVIIVMYFFNFQTVLLWM